MMSRRSPLKAAFTTIFFCCLTVARPAHAQNLYQDDHVEIEDLPSFTAHSHALSDVLATSLETVLHDKEICCGRDSALEDSLERVDPSSLKDIAAKLGGRHLLSDGRPIAIQATYLPPADATTWAVLSMMKDHHAPLMLWNSHLYVVYGMDYRRVADNNGGLGLYIHKLLLWDTRYSDSRRAVVFDRTTEDPSKVQGLLFVLVGSSN